MPKGNFERNTPTKTAKVLGLFMAAVLAAGTGGCILSPRSGHVHVDTNGDGYCDEDGQPMNSSSGGRGWHGWFGSRGTSYAPETGAGGGISSGTSAPKGGIGSNGAGSGG